MQALIAVAVLIGLGGLVAAVLRRKLVTVTVTGMSMEPTYQDGARVLVRRTVRPAPGEAVVVEQPLTALKWANSPLDRRARPAAVSDREWMIKRVAAVPGDPVPLVEALTGGPDRVVPTGRLVLLGDNPDAGPDSRQLGYFPADRVLGVVLRPLSG